MDEISQKFSGTMAVREQHRFDSARLQAYLEENLEGFSGHLTVAQFKGGQSCPTYRLSAGGKHYVLRRKPPGKLLPSAHAVDREYRVLTALAGTDVPVARTYLVCEDEDIVGTIFYLMDCVEGRVFWDQTLPEIAKPERAAYFDAMNRALAALHTIDHEAVGLSGFGKVGQYLERQISRWSKQYKISETEKIEEMDRLIEWLPANIPPGDETCVVHGDYRMDNMIFHATEPRVLAILDWELATLGHPLADFSYHLMSWRLGGDLFRGIAGHDLEALGIPTEDDYIAAYCRRTGREGVGNLDWYLAYNMFRLCGILQGIAKRAIDGTAASEHALEQGRRARPMAEAAWAAVQRMGA